MKVSKAQSQKNHERMVGAASVAFRQHGISTASVADIANSAGLTHGALYGIFPTRMPLLPPQSLPTSAGLSNC